MEKNFTGSPSTQPMTFNNMGTRDYVDEIEKQDWRECCPFNLWGRSKESNLQNEMVYISLFVKNEVALDNGQGGIILPNLDRNPDGLKSEKSRMLSDIYRELGGSNDEESEYSDNMTLVTFIENAKGVKGKGKKPVSEEFNGESSRHNELGDSASDSSTESDYDSDEFTLAALNRNKRALKRTLKKKTPALAPRTFGAKRANPVTAECCKNSAVRRSKRQLRNTTTAPPSSSLGDEENTSGTHEVFSENTETASDAVQMRTRESSPTSDNDMVVAEALLDMANGEVQTDTLAKTVSEEQALMRANGSELDEHVPPASGSGLHQDNQIESEISVCVINRNPSEFETEQARKFMWRC